MVPNAESAKWNMINVQVNPTQARDVMGHPTRTLNHSREMAMRKKKDNQVDYDVYLSIWTAFEKWL